jgi:hypothetical protein
MGKENIENHDKIELRSEKVRKILETIPNRLVH